MCRPYLSNLRFWQFWVSQNLNWSDGAEAAPSDHDRLWTACSMQLKITDSMHLKCSCTRGYIATSHCSYSIQNFLILVLKTQLASKYLCHFASSSFRSSDWLNSVPSVVTAMAQSISFSGIDPLTICELCIQGSCKPYMLLAQRHKSIWLQLNMHSLPT